MNVLKNILIMPIMFIISVIALAMITIIPLLSKRTMRDE